MEERAELDGMQVTVVEQGEQFLGKASILSSGPVHTVMNSGSSWCPFLATLLCPSPFMLHGPFSDSPFNAKVEDVVNAIGQMHEELYN